MRYWLCLGRHRKISDPCGARSIPAGFVARRLFATSKRPSRALPAGRLGRQIESIFLRCLLGALVGVAGLPSTAGAEPYAAQLTGKAFFTALVRGQPDIMIALCDQRVSFDGRWVDGKEAIKQNLDQLVRRAKDQLLQLRQVRLLKLREMTKLFGPPPARLKSAIKSSDLIVLARFTRGGAIAVLGKRGRLWRIKALSD